MSRSIHRILANYYGRVSYRRGLELQKSAIDEHIFGRGSSDGRNCGDRGCPEQTRNVIILLEHEPVYTVGVRNKSYSDALVEELRALGADFIRTDRGGLITYHGPGQLIAYPILNLKDWGSVGVRWYVSNLERTVIDVLGRFGIIGTTSPYTGVWVGDSKICAMGIHVRRYITSHGIALNCNEAVLDWFKHIVPCGIDGKGTTTIESECPSCTAPTLPVDIIPTFLECFTTRFNCRSLDYQDLMSEKGSGSHYYIRCY